MIDHGSRSRAECAHRLCIRSTTPKQRRQNSLLTSLWILQLLILPLQGTPLDTCLGLGTEHAQCVPGLWVALSPFSGLSSTRFQVWGQDSTLTTVVACPGPHCATPGAQPTSTQVCGMSQRVSCIVDSSLRPNLSPFLIGILERHLEQKGTLRDGWLWEKVS